MWKERLKDWEKIEGYMKEKITELNTQVLALKSKSEGGWMLTTLHTFRLLSAMVILWYYVATYNRLPSLSVCN